MGKSGHKSTLKENVQRNVTLLFLLLFWHNFIFIYPNVHTYNTHTNTQIYNQQNNNFIFH